MTANRFWSLFLALSLAVAIGGCGKGKKKDEQTGDTPAVKTGAKGPQRGGHLVLPSTEPIDLNPALVTRYDRVQPLIFEGLVGLDRAQQLRPLLAESWDISQDGKTVTFKLRKGIKWHDGHPLRADDVIFTQKVVMAGGRETVYRAHMEGIESIEAPDDNTVVVRYLKPYGPALSSWTVGIMPAHVYSDDPTKTIGPDAPQGSIGTGPFKFSRWESGQRIVLEANQDYWGGAPYIDSIEFLLNLTSAEQLELLKAGKLDFAEITDDEQWHREAHQPEFLERFETAVEIESHFRMIAWNGLRAQFEDPRVRVALAHALDRQRVVEDLLVGHAQLLSGPFFPTMYGADPSIAPYPFDLANAAVMLDEANYPVKDGKRFTIELLARAATRNTTDDRMLAMFRRDLQSIGVELEVVYLRTNDFFSRIVLREFDAALLGWIPSIPDPDPYELLHSSQINKGPNFAGYSNGEVDKLLDEARATSDRGARKAAYNKVHRIVHQEQPYTMLYVPNGHYAWNRRVRGANARDIGTQARVPGVAQWWIDPTVH